ncbi:MAG: o-succinylbenzoate--CoA ligase [Candidatus Omnitrophica bacterium]|nr:o-succinylbenzoate--CoA ligase [Candidatus Omnitrophota bacterium]
MIIWGTRCIQRQQLDAYIFSCVRQLKGMGMKPGDRVALSAPTSAEYVILLLSLWRMKAVACPIDPHWPVKMTDAYSARINSRHFLKGGDVQKAVCFDPACPAYGGVPGDDLALDQEVTVIATSGTSGTPKAAVHTWGNHFYSAQGSQEMIPLTASDRWLLSLPLYHVAGIAVVVRCFLAGASVVIPNACLPAGRDKDLISAIERNQATHVSLVPAQLYRMLEDPKHHPVLKSLKCILLGGSVLPQQLIERSLSLGLPVYISYGLTEMSSQVATGKPADAHTPCAKVLPYRQMRIASDGEILVKGETLFKGYGTGLRLHLPLTSDGWFQTGDLGVLNARGCLTVLGRKDNMFISGGENIQPEEIEKVLLAIEGVEQAMVVSEEDKEFGHRPVAFVKFNGPTIDSGRLTDILKKELPRFKIPDVFYPWPKGLEYFSKARRREAGKGVFLPVL